MLFQCRFMFYCNKEGAARAILPAAIRYQIFPLIMTGIQPPQCIWKAKECRIAPYPGPSQVLHMDHRGNLHAWVVMRIAYNNNMHELVLFWLTETKSKMCFSRSKNTFS